MFNKDNEALSDTETDTFEDAIKEAMVTTGVGRKDYLHTSLDYGFLKYNELS